MISVGNHFLALGTVLTLILTYLIVRAWWRLKTRMDFYEEQERITSASIEYIPNLLDGDEEGNEEEMKLNEEEKVE